MPKNTDSQLLYFSYAIEDISLALELGVALKVAGLPVWVDRLDCRPSVRRAEQLEQALGECNGIIILLSSKYVTASYCLAELSIAQDRGIPIIPILLEEIEYSVYLPDLPVKPFGEFVNQKSLEKIRAGVESLATYVLGQITIPVRPAVQEQVRFLYLTLAQLECRKVMLNALAASIDPERTTSGIAIRPHPRLISTWAEPGRLLLRGHHDDPEAEAGSHPAVLSSANDIMLSYPRVIVTGESGSGKSSFLIQQAIDMANARLKNPKNALVPVYVDLADWDGKHGIATFIRTSSLKSISDVSLLESDQVCLFIDVPTQGFGDSKRAKLEEWARGASDKMRFIIASNSPIEAPGIVGISLLPLEAGQVRQFLHRYCDDLGGELREIFIDNESLRLERTGNPFWLSVMCYVLKRGLVEVEALSNAGSVMKACLSGLYQQYTNREALHIPWNVLEKAMARLAFDLVDSDSNSRVPIEYAYEMGVTESALRAAQSAGMLIYTDQDRVGFAHPQFEQFFASEGLRIEGLPTRLAFPQLASSGHPIPDKWEPVILQLAGTSDDPSTIAESVSEVNPFLGLKCVTDGLDIANFAIMQVVHRLLGFYWSRGEAWAVAAQNSINATSQPKVRNALFQEARASGWSYRLAAVALIMGLDEPNVPGLREALDGEDKAEQQTVLVAIRKLGDKALPTLFRLLRDDEWSVRQGAAQLLGELGDKCAVPVLVEGLTDANHLVAQACAVALGHLGDKQSVEWLVKALKHADWRVRDAAAGALSLIGKASVDGIEEALRDQDDAVRLYAVQALEGISGKIALKPLLKASYDHDVEVRSAAIRALGKVEDMDAVNRLIESLSDTSVLRSGTERVRDLAGSILRQLGFADNSEVYEAATISGPKAPAAKSEQSQPDISAQTASHDTEKSVRPGEQGRSAAQGKERLKRLKHSNRPAEPLSSEFLKDPDWRVRQAGVLAIPNDADDSTAMPILKKALQDEDNQVRVAAVRKLGHLNTENAIAGLLYALRDKDYLVADTAAEILQSIGKKAIPGLLKLLESKNVNMRGAAVESLGKIADPIAVDSLIECLNDTARPWLSSERICDLAADALFAINTPASIGAVQRWRQQELQSHAQQHHVDFATQSTGLADKYVSDNRDQILTQLLGALHEEEWEKRVDAAKALREYTRGMEGDAPTPVIDRLAAALQDKDWVVRWAVAEALSWIGTDQIVEKIKPLLSDDYWMVRVAAIRTLVEIKAPSAIDALLKVVTDSNDVVREAAAEALGILGDKSVIPALRDLALKDSEEFVRLSAVEALTRLDNPEIAGLLARAAKDDNNHVRWIATRGLVDRATESVLPLLITRLEDVFAPHMESKRVCDYAAEALARIDSLEARLAVENWRQVATE